MTENREIKILLNYLGIDKEERGSKTVKVIDRTEINRVLNSASNILINALINQIRDVRSFTMDLENLLSYKSKVTEVSMKRRKEIERLSVEKNKVRVQELLDQYNMAVFIKTSINILEQDKAYKQKVLQCRKSFINDFSKVYDYLYWNNNVDINTLALKSNVDKGEIELLFQKQDDLISEKVKGEPAYTTYSLSVKGKDLYSFFQSEHRYISHEMDENLSDESMLNEVLEFFIRYAQDKENKTFIRPPKLKTARAKQNFARLKSIIDNDKGYRFYSIIDEITPYPKSNAIKDYVIKLDIKDQGEYNE